MKLIEIKDEVKKVVDTIPLIDNNYKFKQGDVIYVPNMDLRGDHFSSNDFAKYIKGNYKKVKITKDLSKANVIFGYKWEKVSKTRYTWGESDDSIDDYSSKLKDYYNNNQPYMKNGVQHNDAKSLIEHEYYKDHYSWYKAVWAGVIVTHHGIEEERYLIQKYVHENPNVVIIDNTLEIMKLVYDSLSSNKDPFTVEDEEKFNKIVMLKDESILKIFELGYLNRNLIGHRKFFIESFTSNASNEYRAMIKRLMKKDSVMMKFLIYKGNYASGSFVRMLLHLLREGQKANIEIDTNKILKTYL